MNPKLFSPDQKLKTREKETEKMAKPEIKCEKKFEKAGKERNDKKKKFKNGKW